jgi:hypothetical protein
VDDLVVLEAVSTEAEAGLICDILRDAGIKCLYRPTNFAAGAADGWSSGGPREVVVRGEDVGEARRVLDAQRQSG